MIFPANARGRPERAGGRYPAAGTTIRPMPRLEDVFRSQQEALASNLSAARVRELLVYIRDFAALVTDALEGLDFTEPEKQTVLRVLAVDSLSSLFVACRAGLWGNVPEAAVLTRTALETLTIMACVVEEGAFRAFNFEMRSRLRHYSYDQCHARLGDRGARLNVLHGRLSDVGGHTSRNRLKFAEFKIDGVSYDRLGFAPDGDFSETALLLIPDSLQYLAAILHASFAQDRRVFPWDQRQTELNARYAHFIQARDR